MSSDPSIKRRRRLGPAWWILCSSWLGCDWIQGPPPLPPTSIVQSTDPSPRETAVADGNGARATEEEGTSAASADAASAAPVLTDYTRWSLQETAVDTLGRIGAAAVPELTRALQDPDPEMRRRVARILGRIGPDAAAAVPQLVTLLEDRDAEVRRAAARSLGQIGPNAAQAVPALMRLLKDSDSP